MSNRVPRTDIEVAVAQAIRKLGLCDVEVLPLHELQNDLGIDSTEMVELAAIVRGDLGLTRERLDLRKIVTVADMVSQLETMLAARVLEVAS